VPEHAEREVTLRQLDRLDQAVGLRPAAHLHSVAQLVERLVMVRLHERPLGAHGARRARAGPELHLVVAERAGRVPLQVDAHDVLLQRPAERHVEDLHPAADAGQRHIALEPPVRESQLEAVALDARAVRLGVGSRTVARRVDVGAAADQERIDEVEARSGISATASSGGRIRARPPARCTASA
jgi:hypothetical protein